MSTSSLSLRANRMHSCKAAAADKLKTPYFSLGPAPRAISVQASKTPSEVPSPKRLVRPKPATTAQQAQAQAPPPPVSAAQVAEAFSRASDAKTRGEIVDVKVVGQSERGLVVMFGAVRGFIPYSQLDPARLRASGSGDLSDLLGQPLRARVSSVDASRKELVLSERQVAAVAALGGVREGDVLDCVVTGVEDYGAFVQVKGSPEVSGMIHKSEISWERIMTVDQVLAPGQEVRAKVLRVDLPNCRLSLSLKQMSADPLRMSLDDLGWEPAAASPDPRVQALVEALGRAPGVEGVEVTRCAQDPHRVAPELELYLVRSEGEGRYTAVARLGAAATELRLAAAGLSREQVKQLLQRLAARSAAA
ncbi:hypothetical protein Agub_g12313 [Astrephomene gubernaculifera]|uniref:S1 motif domain-containing protein n=1 Tax=Astrephomene gubernaculifera TaxID=47775 RepID=A0AAD3HRP6_9CHLO|nr:hypothetical protein Agub_g12313 [Astrephomene gubernaculifera]